MTLAQHMLPFFKFQKQAVAFANYKKGVLFNLPAGGGKTIISLGCVINFDRVLVIGPGFLRLNWYKEVLKWLPNHWRDLEVITNLKELTEYKAHHLGKSRFIITGYQLYVNDRKEEKDAEDTSKATDLITSFDWDAIIVDESQYVKNWTAARTVNIIKTVCKDQTKVIFLSATPIVRAACDVHPTFTVCQPKKWGSFTAFRERFCRQRADPYSTNNVLYFGVNPKTAPELRERSKAFVFSRKESTILKQLPPFTESFIHIQDKKFKPKDESALSVIESLLERDEELDDGIKTEYERIGLAKVPHVLEWLATIPRKQRVVIFCQHRSVLQAIVAGLEKDGFKPGIIQGKISDKKRMEAIDRFDRASNCRLVCTIGAAQYGYNLQSSSIGCAAELPISDASLYQLKKRIHRIGSKKAVRFYKFMMIESLDQQLHKIITEKKDTAERVGLRVEG